MMHKKPTAETVKGHCLPSPRLTRSGYRVIVLYAALPVLGMLLALDLALWMYFRFALDKCYGIWCFFS